MTISIQLHSSQPCGLLRKPCGDQPWQFLRWQGVAFKKCCDLFFFPQTIIRSTKFPNGNSVKDQDETAEWKNTSGRYRVKPSATTELIFSLRKLEQD